MTDDFLTAFHSSVAVPKDQLIALTEQVMGAEVVSLVRVTQGYANEVYRAEFTAAPTVFIRINRRDEAMFDNEAWALRACLRAGVPVPEVYAVTTLEAEKLLEVMILAPVPGKPLGELWPELDETSQKQVMSSVGEVLGLLHGIKVGGWGKRIGDSWEHSDWQSRAAAMVRDRTSDVPVLQQDAGLTEPETDALLAIVKTMPTLTTPAPVLCHGDLGMDHIFVDNTLKITGIIDFGMCQGGPRELDVAVLNMYHPDALLAWLEPTYTGLHAGLFAREFHQRVLIEQVAVMMGFLAHDLRQGNADYADLAVQGMRAVLRTWRELN